MGTVHGVYLKYVATSALSYCGYSFLSGRDYATHFGGGRDNNGMPLYAWIPTVALGYSAALNAGIAVLFRLEWGMGMLGKSYVDGSIPWWSRIAFWPFHVPNQIYTYLHTVHGKQTIVKEKKKIREHVPVASPLLATPGWWLGGSYSYLLDKDWVCVVDLTSEFPEHCIDRTQTYVLAPTWDGVPPTPEQINDITTRVVAARETSGNRGDVLVHCAHGRGRSTTVMAACLVRAGYYANWKEAFEKGIKPYRPVAKLNRRMRENLTAWQARYVDNAYETSKAQ